jgi:K+-sensing histidine kinase KdpD
MISILKLFRSPTSQAWGYLIAVVSVAVATFLRWLLDPLFDDAHPLLLYYGAVALTAWCGGWWPAVLSLVSGYLAADWFFMPPRQDVVSSVYDPTTLLGCGTFLATGIMIAAFSEAAKLARRRAETNAQILQQALEAARMVTWEWHLSSDKVNSFSNAWKFTSKQPAARIEFGRTTQEGASAYFVRDNGAGFDQTHAYKLFGAFQRLHTTSEFPGTGIGLATVQR